jgi:histidinol dehydrogenase
MKILKTTSKSFGREFHNLLSKQRSPDASFHKEVQKILNDVRKKQDKGLFSLTKRWDQHTLTSKTVQITDKEIRAAYQQTSKKSILSFRKAIRSIRAFHRKQRRGHSWKMTFAGCNMGMKSAPLERVGLYVPGGRAAYPSTVFMNAIPAQVAGVKNIVMVTPFPKGDCNPYTLVAADLLGIKSIYKIGGAQAIAALAYGTESVPKVDKIVGPGNIFVALAKQHLYGTVDIDGIAGPSEVVIIADDKADPSYIAADLLAQAEHDPMAMAILLTPSERLIRKVFQQMQLQIVSLSRREIIEEALKSNGALIKTRDLKEAVALSNEIAPEHVQIMTRQPEKMVSKIRHAGAIFVGPLTPVPMGDYGVGPNHVLPTGGTARFFSPLGVYDFIKHTSVLEVHLKALEEFGPDVIRIAHLEGLTGHAESIKLRLQKEFT